jgi:flagellar motor protein MotB
MTETMMIRSRSTAAALFSAAALSLAACAPTLPPAPPPPPPPVVTGPEAISERTLLTMAADLAFPPGGYNLTRAGRAKLDEIVPALQILQNAKVVVYGYTDDHPVGRALKAKGIVDNLDLSSKRANEVVRYLLSKGVDPNIISAKGRGGTHPVASNDTRQGRAQNRRIEVLVETPMS